MAYVIQLGQTNKSRNSTKVPPTSTSVTVLMKEDSSIIRPTWKLHMNSEGCPDMETLVQYNYCYCPHLKRYYYITNIISVTAAITNIVCEVDVLATFREDILKTPCFVLYSQSRYNISVPDTRLPMLGASKQWCGTQSLNMFSEEGCFALTAVTPDSDGSTGTAATIIVNSGSLSQIASKLYATDFWDSIKTEFYHPEEALLACMWTPLSDSYAVGGGVANIEIGKYNLYTGYTAKKVVATEVAVNFKIPYADTDNPDVETLGDFRNFEPYTKYFLTLPGVGTVDIPMKLIAGTKMDNIGIISIPITISVSPLTGDVTYQIKLMDATGGILGRAVAITLKGNIGVEVPISRTVGRYGSILQSSIGAVGSIGAGAAIGGPMAAIGGLSALTNMSNAVISSQEVNTNVVGSLGGWSVLPNYNYNIEAKTVSWYLSEEPANVASTIGRPLYAYVPSIGSMRGLVCCTGAYVKTWATEEEHKMIANYVNTSVNYLYGGLIVE